MDDFYVYLASSANLQEYTRNECANFTNLLKPCIDLSGEDYYVGLENVYFKPNFVRIAKGDERYKIVICVYEFDQTDETIHEGCWDYVPRQNLLGDTLKELISNFNTDLTRFLVEKNIIEPESPSKIVKTKGDRVIFNRIKYLNKKEETASIVVGWKINYGFKSILGLEKVGLNRDDVHIHNPICPFPGKLPQPVSWLYIYTDIIEPSSVGGQMVDLLSIVPMDHVQTKKSALTLYKKVNKSQIHDISIRVTNENGDSIQFEDGVELLVVLHFKKTE